ncbi:MAG: general secretion pathway protein GspD [Gammaproteobacteria bacterium]|nr:general secretion pathway protein GspD [Gammaproteobacteria bacterium]MBU1482932.1 general secretion pathway protein GspD [Gammaproteobacteria bacterium]
MKSRPVEILLVLWMVAGLGGCANQQPIRDFESGKKMLDEGKLEQGMAQIEKAARADPYNVEYRQFLFKQRDQAVNELLAKAEAERAGEAFDDAVNDYKRVLTIDPNNPRAGDGIALVQGDRGRKQQLAEASALFDKDNLAGAMEKLRPVLAENPNLQEARVLQKRIEEKNAENHSVSASPVLKSALKKTISLEFKDAGLKSVFDVISRVSGLNFVFDKDIKPDTRANIFVKNTTIENAIKLLTMTNQLGQEVLNENTIIIYPDTPAKNGAYQQQVVKSFYLANADVKKTLEMIKTILKTKDVFIDERRNMLVLRETPEVIRLAEKLIASQDLPDPEVELEVEILEINTSRLQNLGLQFPQQISAGLGTAGTYTLEQWKNRDSSFLNFKITDPALALNLKKIDTDTTLLANPRIRVKDRQKANIHIGQRLPVLTTVSTSGVGSSENVTYIDVGLKLDVEPSIRLDNEVDIKVKLEVSSVNQTITLTSGTQVYQLGTRNAETVLRLKDGETQVLAGLIQNDASSSVNKVPGFGDVPLIGRLFSSDSDNKQKTDLVLLITPHVVRNMTRPDELSNQFASGTDSNIGSAPRATPPLVPVQVEVVPASPAQPVQAMPPVSSTVPAASASSVNAAATLAAPVAEPETRRTIDSDVDR